MNSSSRYSAGRVAWVGVYGALIAVTSVVPIAPYGVGGGYLSLSLLFIMLAPLLLGLSEGIMSSAVGGVIAVFVSPAAYSLGLIDAFLGSVLLATCVGLAFNADRKLLRVIFAAMFVAFGIGAELIPYSIPGHSIGLNPAPQPIYSYVIACLSLPWLALHVSPVGYKYVPRWVRSKNKRLRYLGTILGLLIGSMAWVLPWQFVYFLILRIPAEVGLSAYLAVTYGLPLIVFLFSLVSVPIIYALERSGLPAPPAAVWRPMSN